MNPSAVVEYRRSSITIIDWSWVVELAKPGKLVSQGKLGVELRPIATSEHGNVWSRPGIRSAGPN